MHVNFNLSVIIILYIFIENVFFFSECSSKNYLCYAYDQVPFSIVSGGCQSKLRSIIRCSLVWCWSHCVLYYHYFRFIGFDTMQLCGPTGPLNHSPQCSARKVALHRDFPCLGGHSCFRQRLLWGHICNGHTCKVLVLVWVTDARWLPQSILAL